MSPSGLSCVYLLLPDRSCPSWRKACPQHDATPPCFRVGVVCLEWCAVADYCSLIWWLLKSYWGVSERKIGRKFAENWGGINTFVLHCINILVFPHIFVFFLFVKLSLRFPPILRPYHWPTVVWGTVLRWFLSAVQPLTAWPALVMDLKTAFMW